MAKKTISRLSVLAVLIVFLAACSKTSEYTNVIPADASVVASINLKSLASKAGLDDKENEAAKQKIWIYRGNYTQKNRMFSFIPCYTKNGQTCLDKHI